LPRQQVCLEPDAKFAFHGVSGGGEGLADLASLEIFLSYPSWLQDEIASFSDAWQNTASMLPPTHELLVINRAFFTARGDRRCEQASVAALP
jgi:hypothetical protein